MRPAPVPSRTPAPARDSDPVQTGSEVQTRDGASAVYAGADVRSGAAPRRSLLSEAEQAQLEQLRARDREVRAHEAAHAAVGGAYASAPSYSYQAGPDGRLYAVGGSVSIDVSPVPGDPAATIVKMRVVRAAALAPAQPSQSDRQVAAQASQEISKATRELAAERRESESPLLPGVEGPANRLEGTALDAALSPDDSDAPRDARIDKALAVYQMVAGFQG